MSWRLVATLAIDASNTKRHYGIPQVLARAPSLNCSKASTFPQQAPTTNNNGVRYDYWRNLIVSDSILRWVFEAEC